MANTFTELLRLVKIEDMTNTNLWGTIFNSGVIDLAEQSIAGVTDVDVTLSDVTLSRTNGAPDQARSMMLRVIGLPGQLRTITLPELQKMYIVGNETAFSMQFKTASGSPVEVVPGAVTILVVEDVTNEILTFGATNKIAFDVTWNEVALNVAGGSFVVNGHYAKLGDFVTFRIPAFSLVTFTGTTMSLEIDGGMPAQIQRPATTAVIPAGFPVSVIDDGGVEVQTYMQIGTGDSTLDFVSADPGVAFVSGGDRSLPMDFEFTYLVTDD